jgi:hypothetical protein
MTDREVEAKCRKLATDLLPAVEIEALLERLWHLEQVDDIGQVIQRIRVR